MSFLRELRHTGEINSLNDVVVDHMHQPWRTFVALINKSLSRKTTGLDKLRLSKAQILWGMYHQKNVDYVKLLLEDLIYQITTKPTKSKRIFTTLDSPKLSFTTSLPKTRDSLGETRPGFSTEEPTGKSKKVKRHAKKSTKAPARGVVIRETLDMPDAQFEEVRRKTMRDFHKTHPSGSGTITKTDPSVAKIKLSIINEGTGVKPCVLDIMIKRMTVTMTKTQSDNENESDSEHETDESESGSESDHEENEEDVDDEEEVKDEFVKTPSNDSDDEDEIKITNKSKGDEDEKKDYTTNQLYDDVDIRLNEPVDIDKGFVQ
nr:hypothetical protein [Tanacetum cinerariifolium]